jgi:hypothetical protein
LRKSASNQRNLLAFLCKDAAKEACRKHGNRRQD